MTRIIVTALLSFAAAFACHHQAEPTLHPQAPDLGYRISIYGAGGSELEHAVGAFPCRIFYRADSLEAADVQFREADGMTKVCGYAAPWAKEGASATLYDCGGWVEVWGEWSNLGTTERYLLLAHELGHAAGLADDPPVRAVSDRDAEWGLRPRAGVVSIMSRNVVEHANRLELGQLLPVLTDADEAVLERRFCRGA